MKRVHKGQAPHRDLAQPGAGISAGMNRSYSNKDNRGVDNYCQEEFFGIIIRKDVGRSVDADNSGRIFQRIPGRSALASSEQPAVHSQDSEPGQGGDRPNNAQGGKEWRGSGLTLDGSRSELVEGYGRYLGDLCEWEWFFSLTFREPVGEWGAERRFGDWFKFLRRRIGHRPEFVRVTEYQQRGVPHFHGFMVGTDNYRRLSAKDIWYRLGNGYSRVMPYEKERGGSFYLAKYISKDLERGRLEFSRGLQRFMKSAEVRKLESFFGCCEVLPSASKRR